LIASYHCLKNALVAEFSPLVTDEENLSGGEHRMKGSEPRVKRVSAGVSGAILCLKAGVGRTRLSGIERGTISMAPAEADRIEEALNELINAKKKADEVAGLASLVGLRAFRGDSEGGADALRSESWLQS
jgi:hypothetical protein